MSLRTALVACGLCAVCVLAISSRAEDKPPVAREFAGKVLSVTLGDNGGGVVESAQIKTLGDRTFIVATALDMGNQDWRAGARIWLPVSEIRQLVEFNNIDDAKKAYQSAFTNTGTRQQRPARKPSDGL